MKRYSVFIVDDHKMLLSGLTMILESSEDFTVAGSASNAEDAISCIKTKIPDIVLLDITLGKTSGIDLIPKLKEVSHNTKIIIFTMYEDQQHLKAAIKAGASGFLPKKAMDDDLFYAIKTVAEGKVYIYPSLLGEFVNSALKSKDEQTVSNKTARWNSLSNREKNVIIEVARGYTNKEISEKVYLSEKTVATYRARAMAKLGIKSRAECVKIVKDHIKSTSINP
ncbi:MAG: DNA-binding response regulator [bacterium]|nr:MAG: DNA-binding response regulator [bacterium]